MELEFGPRGMLHINDAKIIHRNFAGAPSKFNREGDRNFSVIIPDEEMKEALVAEGWNVKIKPPRDEDGESFMYLPVKIKFNDRGPKIFLKSGDSPARELDEESISCIDNIDIASVDLDIRPYDWEVNGKTGRTAYLQGIDVVQFVDRIAARHQ